MKKLRNKGWFKKSRKCVNTLIQKRVNIISILYRLVFTSLHSLLCIHCAPCVDVDCSYLF